MNTSFPYNPHYDDPYFSPGAGFAEATHVFIRGSGLDLNIPRGITIGETGFGTGLNLWALLTHLPDCSRQPDAFPGRPQGPADALDQPAEAHSRPAGVQSSPAGSRDPAENENPMAGSQNPAEAQGQPAEAHSRPAELQNPAEERDVVDRLRGQPRERKNPAEESPELWYWSVDAYPLEWDQLQEWLQPYWDSGELSALNPGDVRSWYQALGLGLGRLGWHLSSWDFRGWRVRLALWQGDVEGMLSALGHSGVSFHGWFLDGHSPEKNPQMWSSEVLQDVGALTLPGGFAVTYSAAGVVKAGLRRAGFQVVRRPGFGVKRHMVVARKPASGPEGVFEG